MSESRTTKGTSNVAVFRGKSEHKRTDTIHCSAFGVGFQRRTMWLCSILYHPSQATSDHELRGLNVCCPAFEIYSLWTSLPPCLGKVCTYLRIHIVVYCIQRECRRHLSAAELSGRVGRPSRVVGSGGRPIGADAAGICWRPGWAAGLGGRVGRPSRSDTPETWLLSLQILQSQVDLRHRVQHSAPSPTYCITDGRWIIRFDFGITVWII